MNILQEPRALLKTINDPVTKTIALLRVKDGESAEKAARYCKVPTWLVQRWVMEGVVPHGSPFESPRKPHCRASDEDNRKLVEVVRNNPGISIKQAIAISKYPASEQTARKRIKESNVDHLGPKKAKLPLDVATQNWAQCINQELQKVIDLFDDENED